jgi:hypothetical protein
MRQYIIAAVVATGVAVVGSSLSGCTSWWKQFESNPVAEVQSFEQGVQIVLNDAQLAWTIVQPYLPPATAAAINAQFVKAVADVNHALSVLNDAVQVAVAAQTSNPDFSTMMAAVTDAIAQVLAIIDQYTNLPIVMDGGAAVAANNGKAPMSPMLADAHAGLASLKAHWVPAKVVPVAAVKAPVAAPIVVVAAPPPVAPAVVAAPAPTPVVPAPLPTVVAPVAPAPTASAVPSAIPAKVVPAASVKVAPAASAKH